jgi:hypothetical protein
MGLSIHPTRYLERSEHGVYFAAVDNYRLRVWILKESGDQKEWILKYNNDLEPVLAPHRSPLVHVPWVLKDVNYNLFCSHLPDYKKKDILEEMFEWNSDSDDVDNQVKAEGCYLAENKKATVKQKLQQCSYNENVSENRDTAEEFLF